MGAAAVNAVRRVANATCRVARHDYPVIVLILVFVIIIIAIVVVAFSVYAPSILAVRRLSRMGRTQPVILVPNRRQNFRPNRRKWLKTVHWAPDRPSVVAQCVFRARGANPINRGPACQATERVAAPPASVKSGNTARRGIYCRPDIACRRVPRATARRCDHQCVLSITAYSVCGVYASPA